MGIIQTIKILAILAIVSIIAGSVWYVTGLRADLAVSEENTKQLVVSVSQQQDVIAQIQSDQKQIQAINANLAGMVAKQMQDVNSLRDRFSTSANGDERDLGKIAIEKPALIVKIINKASIKAVRCLELASGSPLTKDELNVPNSECPSLTPTN
tara:strand:+ start:2045 stop:2506 length:462 start_codon:yes stop_codon:yes gene_type:complete